MFSYIYSISECPFQDLVYFCSMLENHKSCREHSELKKCKKHGLAVNFQKNINSPYVLGNFQHFSKFDLFDLCDL